MGTLGRLLPLDDREPNALAISDPSSAQIQLWLAHAQRDHSRISGREMARMESTAGPMASRSRVIFNPFTGEVRKIDADGNQLFV